MHLCEACSSSSRRRINSYRVRLEFSALRAEYPCLQNEPFGILLRVKVLAAAVEAIPTRFFHERMAQERALQAARYHHAAVLLEILARGFLVPHGSPRRQHRQVRMQALVDHVAGNAA